MTRRRRRRRFSSVEFWWAQIAAEGPGPMFKVTHAHDPDEDSRTACGLKVHGWPQKQDVL